MGIEKLNAAAWAAGFSMAASEDDFADGLSIAPAVETRWRSGQAVMVREASVERVDWMRALLALFARRAPVSPA